VKMSRTGKLPWSLAFLWSSSSFLPVPEKLVCQTVKAIGDAHAARVIWVKSAAKYLKSVCSVLRKTRGYIFYYPFLTMEVLNMIGPTFLYVWR
jgi:hypothetical protein